MTMSEVIMPDLVAQDASCDAFFHALAGFTGVPFNPTDSSDASSDDGEDLHDDLDVADMEQTTGHRTTTIATMNDDDEAEEDPAKVTFGASVGSDTRTDRTLEPAKDNHQLDGDDAHDCTSPPLTCGARQGGGLTSSISAGGAFKEDHAMHAAVEDPRAGCVEHPPNGTTAFEASTRTLATALAAEHPLRAEVLRDLSYITRSPQITAATSHLLLHLSHKFSDVAGVSAKDAKLAQIGESQEQELSVLVEAHDGEVDQLYLRSVVLKHQRQLAQHGSQWEQRRSRQYQDAVAEFVAFVRNAAKDIRRKEIAAATALAEASTSRAPSQGNSKKQPAGVSASRSATTTTNATLNLDKDEKGAVAAAGAKEAPAKRPTATALFPTTASAVKEKVGSDESSDADERSPTTSGSPNGNVPRPSSSSSPTPIGKSATIAGGSGGTGSPSRATPQGKPTTPTPLQAQKQPPSTPTTVLSYPALPAVQDAGSIIEPGTRTSAARVRAVPATSALDGLGFSHTTACVSVDYGVEQLVPAALLTFPNPLAHVDRALQDPRPKPTRRHPHGPLSSQPLVAGGRRHSSSSHGAGHGHGAQATASQKVDAAGGGSAPPSPIRGGGGTLKPRARQPTSRDPTLAAISVEIGCVADLSTICTLSTNDNACALRTPYLMSSSQSTGTVATDGKSKKTPKQSSAAKKASALSNATATGGSVSGSYSGGGGGAGGAGGGGNGGGGSGSSGAQHPHLKTDHLDLDGRVALSTAEVDSAVARRLGKHLHRLTAQHRHGVMVLVGPPSEFGAMLAPALDTAIDPIVAFGQPSVSLLPQPSTASAAGSGGVRSTSSWSPAPSPTNAASRGGGGGGGGSAAVQVPSSSRTTGSVPVAAAGAGSASARSGGGFSPFSLSPKAPGSLSSAPQKQPMPPSASARFQDPLEACAGSPTEDISAMAEFYNSFGPAILPNAFLCADNDEALSGGGRGVGAVTVQSVVSPHVHAAVTAFERMRHLAQAIVDGDLCVRSVPLEDITGLSVYLACVSGHHALHATHSSRCRQNNNASRKGQKRDHRSAQRGGSGGGRSGGGDCLSAVEVEGLRHELRMATSDIDGLVTASSLDACISLSPKNGGLDRPTSTSLDLQSQRLALHSPNTPTLQAAEGDSGKGKTAFGVGAGGGTVSQDRSAFAGIERDGRRKMKTAASTSRGLSAALGAVASTIATGHDIVLGFLASDVCSASVAEAATRLVRSSNAKKTNAISKLNDAAPQEIVGSDGIGGSEGIALSASAATTVDRQRGTGPLLSKEEAVDLDDSLREVWATLCDVLFECPSAANAALAEISSSCGGLSLSGVRSPPASAAMTSAQSDSDIDNGAGDDVHGGESDSSPFSKCLTQLLPALSSMLAVDNGLQQHQDGRQGQRRSDGDFGGKVSTARAAETAALVQALLKRRQRAVPSFVEKYQASQESLSFFTQRLKAAAAFTALSAAEADLHAVVDACLNICIARLADRLLSTSSSASSSIHGGVSVKTRALANAASQQQGAQATKQDEDAKSSRPGSRPSSRPVSRPVSRRSSKVDDDDDDDDAIAATEASASRVGDGDASSPLSSAQHRRNDTWCSVTFSEIIRNASNGLRNPTANPHAAGEGQGHQKSSGGAIGSHHPESCVVSAVPLRNGALWGGDLLLCSPRVEHCTAAFISAIVGHCVSDWTADLLTIAVAPSVGPSLGAAVLSRVVDGIARVQRASSMVRLPNVAFPIPKPLPPSSYGFSLLTAYTDKSPYVRHAVDSFSPEPGSSGGNGSFNSASGGHHGGHHHGGSSSHQHQSTSRSAAGGVASALGKFAAGAGQAVTFGVLRRGGKDKDTTSVSDAETASSATGGSTPVAASPSAHAAHSMGLNTPPPKGTGLAGGGGFGGGRGSPRMSRVTSDVAPTNTGVAVRVLLPVVDLSAARAIGATLNGVEVGCRDPARDLLKAAVTIATGDE